MVAVLRQVVDGDVVEYGAESRSTMRFGTYCWLRVNMAASSAHFCATCVLCVTKLADEYLGLLETQQAGKRYLKDWHFVHAFKDSPVYTYVLSYHRFHLRHLMRAECMKTNW